MPLGRCKENRADFYVPMGYAFKTSPGVSLAIEGLVSCFGVYFKTQDGCHVLAHALDLRQLQLVVGKYATKNEKLTVVASNPNHPKYLEKKTWLNSVFHKVTYLLGRSMVVVNGLVNLYEEDGVFTRQLCAENCAI